MRYFVTVPTEDGPAIIAELLRESFDDGAFRDSSLAANLAGPTAQILTDDELRARADGEALLQEWVADEAEPTETWLGDVPVLVLVRDPAVAARIHPPTTRSERASALHELVSMVMAVRRAGQTEAARHQEGTDTEREVP